MLYSNDSFNSYDFGKLLSNFNNISMQIQYNLELMKSLRTFVSLFIDYKSSKISFSINFSSSTTFIESNSFEMLQSSQSETAYSTSLFEDYPFQQQKSNEKLKTWPRRNCLKSSAAPPQLPMEDCSKILSSFQLLIPSSILEIRKYAFKGCTSLSKISIPSSVKQIEAECFYECSSLSEILIPSSITRFGKAIYYFDSLY